jgi:hypothetical protein
MEFPQVSPRTPARQQMKRSAGYPIAITVALRIDMNQATGSSLVAFILHEISQSKHLPALRRPQPVFEVTW